MHRTIQTNAFCLERVSLKIQTLQHLKKKEENLFVGSPREQPLKADFTPPHKKIKMAEYLHPIMSELFP